MLNSNEFFQNILFSKQIQIIKTKGKIKINVLSYVLGTRESLRLIIRKF